MALKIVPISLRGANAYVRDHHRHHKPTVGHKFSIACADGQEIVGVAIVGRPVSRHLDDYWTLEVNRLCTDGTRNACSMLYAAAWRVARAMGYKRLITYILESEPGTSLKAVGWKCMGKAVAQLYGMERIVKHVRRECNAAVKQLRQIASCETCKHIEQCSEGCEPHNACSMGQNWEWNGGTSHDRP